MVLYVSFGLMFTTSGDLCGKGHTQGFCVYVLLKHEAPGCSGRAVGVKQLPNCQ